MPVGASRVLVRTSFAAYETSNGPPRRRCGGAVGREADNCSPQFTPRKKSWPLSPHRHGHLFGKPTRPQLTP